MGLLLSAGHPPSPSPHGGLGGGARWGWDARQPACHSHTDRHPRVSSSEWRLAPEQGSVLFQALTPVSICPSFISSLELSQLSDSQFSKPSVPERCSPSACLLPSPERYFGFAVTAHGGSEKGRWPAGAELAVDPSRLSPPDLACLHVPCEKHCIWHCNPMRVLEERPRCGIASWVPATREPRLGSRRRAAVQTE